MKISVMTDFSGLSARENSFCSAFTARTFQRTARVSLIFIHYIGEYFSARKTETAILSV